MFKLLLVCLLLLCGGIAWGQEIPASTDSDPVMNFIKLLPFNETTAFWVAFLIAALRGLAATVAEWIPNKALGPFVGLIDFLGGNQKNAAGSQ